MDYQHQGVYPMMNAMMVATSRTMTYDEEKGDFMRRALVPGTFDPITAGHLDVITRASQLFDEVVVGVAESRSKHMNGTMFTLEERTGLVEESVSEIPNVVVRPFGNLLVDFAAELGARVCVKGLRAVTDFEYEFQMAALNYRIAPQIETVFIMSTPDHMYLSSSIVKEMMSLGGDIHGLVPPCVEKAMSQRVF